MRYWYTWLVEDGVAASIEKALATLLEGIRHLASLLNLNEACLKHRKQVKYLRITITEPVRALDAFNLVGVHSYVEACDEM